MNLQRTRSVSPRCEWRERTPSTNDELMELAHSGAAAHELPHGTLIASAEQTAGRGRRGRVWEAPSGTSLAASLLIREFGVQRNSHGALQRVTDHGWLPLLVGTAIATALQPWVPSGMRVGLKWPNDVHVRSERDAEAGRPGLKLCGVLCEIVDPDTVVAGFGMNVLLEEWDLPTPRATSLLLTGADLGEALTLHDEAGQALADQLLAETTAEILRLVSLASEDVTVVSRLVTRHSLTLGSKVRVHLPDGTARDGTARALAADGALEIDLPTGGSLTVHAGDVEHLRAL